MMERPEAAPASRTIRAISRPQAGRAAADAVRILPDNALVFADESHVTIPQIGGCSAATSAQGDAGRIRLRLPSCMDNRPLRFEEWDHDAAAVGRGVGDARRVGTERGRRRVRQQVIRPTG